MPPQTSPFAKGIRTLEGQLVIASDAILALGAALPAHVISPKWAAIVVAVQHVALIVQRTVIKLQAANFMPTTNVEDDVLKVLDAIEQSQHAFQSSPGTPAHLIPAGLAPDVEQPAAA